MRWGKAHSLDFFRVAQPFLWAGAGDSVCVTLTRIFRTSGSDTLVLPNFWMLKDAIFMVAAEGEKKTEREKKHYRHFNESVCV